MIHSFGHLDGYSALYYTYMWSLVIAKDIFAEIESGETAAKQIKLAKKYMRDILCPVVQSQPIPWLKISRTTFQRGTL